MRIRSKRYQTSKQLIDANQLYSVSDAVKLAKETANTKFVNSIDIAIKLNLDTKKAEQQLRGNLALPYYFGKTTRVLVLDDTLTKEKAKEAKIDYFGGTDMIAKIKEGWLEFDVIITIPKFMPLLAPLGKILGPKGLMPNPKLGTVTPNVLKTAEEFKAGKYSYRTDSYGNVHMKIGTSNAIDEQIIENINFFLDFIKSKRPATVKGAYFEKIVIKATMSPAIKVELPK